MKITDQLSFSDIDPEYKNFVEKFKPKKTTDDCYTPERVFNAVLSWVISEYGIDQEKIVRPFWPGADYLDIDYPDGCTVVDNPPFSIIAQICKNYLAAGIKFFLFAPYLTNLSTYYPGLCHIITDAKITYENGAKVNTAFLTNLDSCIMRTAPELAAAIMKANKDPAAKPLPVYKYPDNVVTATRLGGLSRYGVECKLYPEECYFVRGLDDQKAHKKTLFGAGYLVSEKAAQRVLDAEQKAAANKAAAAGLCDDGPVKVWVLSDRERAWVESLK